MHYQVSRNGQIYGPYTLDDLQRYTASGNVLGSDLVKQEQMQDWITVSQLLSGQVASPVQNVQPVGSAPAFQPLDSQAFQTPQTPASADAYLPAATPAVIYSDPSLETSAYPDAPNLHWGLLLLFTVLTCYLFMPVWNLVVSAWLRRVQPRSTALFYYSAAYALLVVNYILGAGAVAYTLSHAGRSTLGLGLASRLLVGAVVWILRLVARYMERASLEEHFNIAEPMGLRLDAVLTFFFGGLYFQSQLNRLNASKQAARYATGRAF